MTNKELETKVAVQGEKIDNIEDSLKDLKQDIKDNYNTTDKKIDRLTDAMDKHMDASTAANNKIVWYLLGGMGTIVLFLLGIMFK